MSPNELHWLSLHQKYYVKLQIINLCRKRIDFVCSSFCVIRTHSYKLVTLYILYDISALASLALLDYGATLLDRLLALPSPTIPPSTANLLLQITILYTPDCQEIQ